MAKSGSGGSTVKVISGSAYNDVIDVSGSSYYNPVTKRTVKLTNTTSGQESIIAGDGHDTVNAGGGNDTVLGGNGNDLLRGGTGNDSLMGEAGNDTLEGGAGNDTLDGGSDINTASFEPSSTGVMLNLGTVDGSGFATATTGTEVDKLKNIRNLIGGSGDDQLTGDSLANLMRGGSGRDTLDGGEGDDTLYGGNQGDLIRGGGGADLIYGDNGSDDLLGDDDMGLLGQAGNDTLWGGNGKDVMDGGTESDHLHGGNGTDTLQGGAGDDHLWGDLGNDSLDGGAGNDAAYFSRPAGEYTLVSDISGTTVTGADGTDIVRNVEQFYFNGVLKTNEAPSVTVTPMYPSGIPEGTDTTLGLKVANVTITDDGLGYNQLSLEGGDAGSFYLVPTGMYTAELWLQDGILDFETKSSFDVEVHVDDSSIAGVGNFASLSIDVVDLLEENEVRLLDSSRNYLGTYATIQAAVNAAVNGQIVLVAFGLYNEVVTVNKSITIEGAQAGVSGKMATRTGPESVMDTGGFHVTADGVTIDGFKFVQGAAIAGETTGVYVSADDVTLTNLLMERASQDTSRGVVTETGKGSGLTVTRSDFAGFLAGVFLNGGSDGVSITDNSFSDNGVGVANDGLDVTDAYLRNTFVNQTLEHAGVLITETIDVGAVIADGGTDANDFVTIDPAVPDVAMYSAVSADGAAVTGTDFEDRFYGSAFGESVMGEAGADTLSGEGGDDTLAGGAGNDSLDGGAGNDRVTYDALDVTIAGGAHIDTLVVSVSSATIIDLSAADQTSGDDADVTGFENVDGSGSTASLTLTGSTDGNVLVGGSAGDTIAGGAGVDTLTGGAGSDTLYGGTSVADDDNTTIDTATYDTGAVSWNATLGAWQVTSGLDVDTLHGIEKVVIGSDVTWLVDQTGDGGLSSIQSAIDQASDGGETVMVAPGTYTEYVTINKQGLQLVGPNAGKAGVDPTRGAEAIIQFPAGDITGAVLVSVATDTDDVLISGFDIRSDDARVDEYNYLVYTQRADNLEISSNRLYSSEIALYITVYDDLGQFAGVYRTGLLIKDNYIDGGPNVNSSYNRGMYVQATAGTIEDNVVESVNIGIQYMPYAHTTPGFITGNTVSAGLTGLYHNYQNKGAAPVTWSDNVVTVAPNDRTGLEAQVDGAWTTPVTFRGIQLITFGTEGVGTAPTVNFTGNTVDASLQAGETYNSTVLEAVRVSTAGAGTTINLEDNTFTGYTLEVNNGSANVYTLGTAPDFNAWNGVSAPVKAGGTGADVLVGTSGADILLGGGGSDQLQGGLGVDRYNLTEAAAAVDTVTEDGSAVAVSGSAISGFDLITKFATGQDVLVFAGGVSAKQTAGTYDPVTGTFVVGNTASDDDVMVWNDQNTDGLVDVGELAVVLVGVAADGGAVDLNGAGTGNGY